MAENHRKPSRYNMDERNKWRRLRQQQKLMGRGGMKAERGIA